MKQQAGFQAGKKGKICDNGKEKKKKKKKKKNKRDPSLTKARSKRRAQTHGMAHTHIYAYIIVRIRHVSFIVSSYNKLVRSLSHIMWNCCNNKEKLPYVLRYHRCFFFHCIVKENTLQTIFAHSNCNSPLELDMLEGKEHMSLCIDVWH